VSYSLVGADRNTHLKIAAVALACSLLAGLAFHGSLLADAAPKDELANNQFADAAQIGCTKPFLDEPSAHFCPGTSYSIGRF